MSLCSTSNAITATLITLAEAPGLGSHAVPRIPSQATEATSTGTPGAGREIAPLLSVIGSDLEAPLVDGGTARYVQLDVAASAPALTSVAERVSAALPFYSSVHRGAGYASQVSTGLYEGARAGIGAFVGARAEDSIVITRNTTDALNLLARAVPAGQEVIFFDHEHHANLLPWRQCLHRCLPTGSTVAETLSTLERALATRPVALVAITGASNVTGEVLPIGEIARLAHAHGARIVVDGAQLVPHRRVDLAALDLDYLVFSGHKLYAPFGAGALVGRSDWLDAAEPYLAGGGAVRSVTGDSAEWATGAQRHEAGTPNVLGAVAIAAACAALAALPPRAVLDHEEALVARLEAGLAQLTGVRTLRIWADSTDRVGVVGFTVAGHSPLDVAEFLSNHYAVGVRHGKFCAHPLLDRLDAAAGAVRASVGVGTSSGDVDRLLEGLRALIG